MGSSDRLPDLKVRETFTISEQTKQAVAVAGCAAPWKTVASPQRDSYEPLLVQGEVAASNASGGRGLSEFDRDTWTSSGSRTTSR